MKASVVLSAIVAAALFAVAGASYLVTRSLDDNPVQPVDLEVRRRVLGVADSVGQEGVLKQLDLASLGSEVRGVSWWGWWNWPYWWFRFNGFAEFRWKVALKPGESVKLDAGWHYFWQ